MQKTQCFSPRTTRSKDIFTKRARSSPRGSSYQIKSNAGKGTKSRCKNYKYLYFPVINLCRQSVTILVNELELDFLEFLSATSTRRWLSDLMLDCDFSVEPNSHLRVVYLDEQLTYTDLKDKIRSERD